MFCLVAFFILSLGNSVDASTTEDVVSTESILLEKGFSVEEIESMNVYTKEKIATSEGERGDYEVSVAEYYNSLDGKKIKVTDKNREIVNQIMNNDRMKYSEKAGISVLKMSEPLSIESTNGGISVLDAGKHREDGKLSFSAFVTKTQTGTYEYRYKAFLDFSWSSAPLVWGNFDHIAMAWDNKFTGVANSVGSHYFLLPNFKENPMHVTQAIYGISAKFAVWPEAMIGGLSQDVKVSRSLYTNETGKFRAVYIHSLAPITGGVSIGPLSIDVPPGWLAQEFALDFNLTIGS